MHVAREIELHVRRARDLRGDDADRADGRGEREGIHSRANDAEKLGPMSERNREFQLDRERTRSVGESSHRGIQAELDGERRHRFSPALEPRSETTEETAENEQQRLCPAHAFFP